MRVPIVLLGLVATPLAVVAAQSGSAAVKDPAQCAVADANRSPQSWSRDRKPDSQNRSRTGCSPVVPSSGGTTGDPPPPPPPPDTTPTLPPPPPPPPPPPGSVAIDGNVWNDGTGAALAGWTVTISGPVSSSTVTDANGHYLFSGIPAGTYTVCEVVQSGWSQDFPTMAAACVSGKGYNFTLTAGGSGSFVDFGNLAL